MRLLVKPHLTSAWPTSTLAVSSELWLTLRGVLIALTWESGSWRSACSLCFVRQPTLSSATCLRKRDVRAWQGTRSFPEGGRIESNQCPRVSPRAKLASRIKRLNLSWNSPVSGISPSIRFKHIKGTLSTIFIEDSHESVSSINSTTTFPTFSIMLVKFWILKWH